MEQFTVTGMTCAACSAHVEKAVLALPGVKAVAVSLLTHSMGVEMEDPATPGAVVAAVEKAGYGASYRPENPAAETTSPAAALEDTETPALKRRLFSSLGVLAVLMYVTMGSMVGLPLPAALEGASGAAAFAFTQFLLTLPILYLNRAFFVNGFKGLANRAPGMDALVALGAGASLVYSIWVTYKICFALGAGDMAAAHAGRHDLYFEGAAMILTLITLGKMLEARSKGRTTSALKSLLELAPRTATLLEEGAEKVVPADKVKPGDVFLVRPGEQIPVDGIVLEGESAVNEAALTGESMPADKAAGDEVSAATLNQTGVLKCTASRVGQDTTLSQIIKMVTDAAATKAPIARMADKVSGIFVPAVITLALGTLAVWLALGQTISFALARAISVLVISCPCALGLATPVAIMVGSGLGARHGILFKTAAALESAGRVEIVVLDKTGTVTSGRMQVRHIAPAPGTDTADLLACAAALEENSEHPVAKAVREYTAALALPTPEVTGFEALPGNGVRAFCPKTGRELLGGSAAFVDSLYPLPPAIKEEAQRQSSLGCTPLCFAREGRVLGLVAVADSPRPTSKEAIRRLKEMGLRVVMLTGDNLHTARAVADQVGIEEVIAQVLPGDKEAQVRRLQQEGRVAMVGDGINDAPALTRADLGVAIGAGTDVAIDAADLVLMQSDLLGAARAIRLGRCVLKNIRQNLFWAFCYNTVGIPVAAGCFAAFGLTLNPMLGAAAMSLSSFCVVTNALRLNFAPLDKGGLPAEQDRSPAFAAAPAAEEDTNQTNPNKGETAMTTKTIKIEGMMCMHCRAHVDKALNALEGVQATVDLEAGKAVCQVAEGITNEALTACITEAGYTVTGIEE